MKQLTGLILTFLIAFTTSAGEIKFANNLTWKQIKEKAIKEKKMIFFDAYTTWCGPCKYLEKNVYTNEGVSAYYNANFINVKFDMESGEGLKLSGEFSITSYPTLLFFSAEGNLVHKYIGAMEAAAFVELGKTARNPSKQYFVLKEKATKMTLSDVDFNYWAEQADGLEDEDKESIISKYLNSKTDILGNKSIANTVLMYTDDLTDKQLSYLHASQVKIGQLMGWNAERTSSVLYKKLFKQAAKAYSRSFSNIDSFSALIRKFDPKKENYAVKDLLFRLAVYGDKDMDKATDLLISYLGDTKKPIEIEFLAGWLLDYSDSFETENFKKINEQLNLFKFRSIDAGKEYWLYLMQVLCNIKSGDEAKAKIFAAKAYQHAGLPVEYKEILKDSYGFTD